MQMGNTGLHISCLAGKLDVVKLLLDVGGDPNALAQVERLFLINSVNSCFEITSVLLI